MLQQAPAELLSVVAENASEKKEEVFFERIEGKLIKLCEEIAQEVQADSAAVFFVTEDNPPGSGPFIVMRGASGRLEKTFRERVEGWREWRNGECKECPDLSGFAYVSELTGEFQRLEPKEQQQVIQRWSITNQIWHLAQGCIANSNRAMDEMHGGSVHTGRGDAIAYGGTNLHVTFRTMIGVPIFAQGGSVQTVTLQKNRLAEEWYPPSASSGTEFLSKYRVIGILKVEGKQPLDDEIPTANVVCRRLKEFFDREQSILGLSDNDKRQLEEWCTSICDQCKTAGSLKVAFDQDGIEFPGLLRDTGQDDEANRKTLLLRKGIVDVLTRCCHAEFTRQDIELLVLLAMQVGRLMIHRAIKYAAEKDIIISENEVGLLNVRWRDIDHLVVLRQAAEAAKEKVNHHIEALRAELDFDKRQEVYRARVSELLDPHGAIREVTARTKEFSSLIRKLARKQQQLERDPDTCEVAFTDSKFRLEGYGHQSGERCVVRGDAQFMLHRPSIGSAEVDFKMALGTEGSPQVTINEKNMLVALRRRPRAYDPDLPLVRRILDPDIYHVDDLAGVRVIADYDSDIDEVLDALKARVSEWGIELGKVDDLREGKEGGYRAVHVTLYVYVEPLLPLEDVRILREALRLPVGRGLKIPVEIQLRTAYQHSWAIKVHQILYKREEQVAQELRDEQEILSNVLAEADWLSDIVRGDIERMLLPSDYDEHKLLEYLKRRIPLDDMNTIRFGIACTKEILKDKLRYNGQPEFSFAMQVCNCLVHKFRVIDSTMLLLSLLYNAWHGERNQSSLARSMYESMHREGDEDIVSLFCVRMEQTCGPVLSQYRRQLPLSAERRQDASWFRAWMAEFPIWFWAIQSGFRNYFLWPPEDMAAQRRERLQNIYRQLVWRHREGQWRESLDEWLERAYMLESAILLADLTSLPGEPGRDRRKRLHNDYLTLFREIRKYLPNGPTKTHIIEILDRAFREIEIALDLAQEPEWWGE